MQLTSNLNEVDTSHEVPYKNMPMRGFHVESPTTPHRRVHEWKVHALFLWIAHKSRSWTFIVFYIEMRRSKAICLYNLSLREHANYIWIIFLLISKWCLIIVKEKFDCLEVGCDFILVYTTLKYDSLLSIKCPDKKKPVVFVSSFSLTVFPFLIFFNVFYALLGF